MAQNYLGGGFKLTDKDWSSDIIIQDNPKWE